MAMAGLCTRSSGGSSIRNPSPEHQSADRSSREPDHSATFGPRSGTGMNRNDRPYDPPHGLNEIRTRVCSFPGAMSWGSKRLPLVVDCLRGTFAPRRSRSCRDPRPKVQHPRPAVGSSPVGGGCRHHRPRDRVGGRTGWRFPWCPRHGEAASGGGRRPRAGSRLRAPGHRSPGVHHRALLPQGAGHRPQLLGELVPSVSGGGARTSIGMGGVPGPTGCPVPRSERDG